jgi:signal transduction histidine kinase
VAIRRLLVDLGLAAVFAVCLVIGSVSAAAVQVGRFRGLDVLAFVLIVAAAFATLGLRRIAPVGALTATMVPVSAYLLAGYPYGPVQLCMVIAMFEVARQRPMRTSLVACGLATAAASGTVLARLMYEDVQFPGLLAMAWTGWIVLPWSLGALTKAVAAVRERARRDLVATAALEERMRLAGEVHDVAGHGFAVVAMQAGVALQVFDENPTQVRTSLEAIQTTSEASLSELRGMLDIFHPREPEERGLDGVRALVDELRAGGLQVGLAVEDVDPVRQVGVVAYRVVQESLTNVLRHAGPTRADVRIGGKDGELLVQVLDHGQGSPEPPEPGRGLAVMRERVEAVGGRLEAGPRDGGGFAVTARLPMGGAR